MNAWILFPIFFPMLAGAVLLLPMLREKYILRRYYVAAVVIANAAVVLVLTRFEDMGLRAFEITPVISLYLRMDELARFFLIFAALLWVPITFYAFDYIRPEDRKGSRYFAFFLMTYGVILGVSLAGNFFTLYLFYELATLLTYPLVIHTGTPAAY